METADASGGPDREPCDATGAWPIVRLRRDSQWWRALPPADARALSPPTETTMRRAEDATELLRASTDGSREALDALFPMVYQELRRMARRQLQMERTGHTLGTTGLLHETYLKLVKVERLRYRDRAHFFAIAARAMRWVLVSYATRRKAAKRGGGRSEVPLDDAMALARQRSEELLALEDALRRLEAEDPRHGQVVECRFFGGMSIEETAEALGVSPATVKRDWTLARAWLHRELAG